MSRLIKFGSIPVLALALMLAAPAERADAGGFGISVGSFGYGPSIGYRSYHAPAVRYGYGRGISYSSFYGSSYRHYNSFRHPHVYQRPVVVPRRSPYHYAPGFRYPAYRHPSFGRYYSRGYRYH